MTSREQVVQLLDLVPEYKMGYILAYVQGLTADEEADDQFCQRMMEEYQQDTDPEKERSYSLEVCKKEWGID